MAGGVKELSCLAGLGAEGGLVNSLTYCTSWWSSSMEGWGPERKDLGQ